MIEFQDQPPTIEAFEKIARAEIKTMPDEMARHVRDVVIRVADFPDQDVREEMAVESPYDLLGLYQGVSIDRKSVSETPQDVDMIFLYRMPILVYCEETGEGLIHVVRHVLIHEIGHHFGFSDEDMDRIERDG